MKFKIGDIVVYEEIDGTVKYGVVFEGKTDIYSFYEHENEHPTYKKVACSAYPKINGYMDTDEAMARYILNDIDMTDKLYAWFTLNLKEWEEKCIMSKLNVATIKSVIFNDPATIVFWVDGTKTVVKAENEKYDPEKGLAMAIAKRALGNEGSYYNIFRKWLPKEEPKPKFEEDDDDNIL